MKISVFGLGYVGSVTAACFAHKKHRVIGVEVNTDKLAMFRRGKSPLFEPGLEELLAKTRQAKTFAATDDAKEAVVNSEISFICVGTPGRKDGAPDLSHIETVARQIGEALKAKPTLHLVAVRSTMLPGSIETVIVQSLERASGRREGRDFHVVANPEFMREGTAIKDFFEPPFVVIGERAAGAGQALAELYRCVKAPLVRVSIGAAEAIKFACNAFHGLKITFANEFGQFCKAHGIDAQEVMEVFSRDTKLNLSRAYLRPGLAFGGSCLPKDLRALLRRSRERDLELPMLEAVARSNALQIQRTTEAIAEIGNREVAFLGLSFKAGTDDLRESPVVIMAESLLGKGFKLAIHDSEVELTRLTGANKVFLESKLPHINSLLVPSLKKALASSRTLVVCKQHADYAGLSKLVGKQHCVVDLVGFLKSERFPPNGYRGLYW
jgi:GDP-mannose 6-dehydrogenase